MFLKRALLILILALGMAGMVAAIGEDTDTPDDDTAPAAAEEVVVEAPADIPGPKVITGNVTYSNPFFTTGVSQPLVLLEDQAGFIDRNEYFLFPPESQVLGQITSDFFTSPFTYSLSLPIEPQGTLRDVDNDGQTDSGVMVFAVAYWSNSFGDPFLEERDMSGGGWSGAYASTRLSSNPEMRGEVVGGKYLIYAPEAGQGFPSDFGADDMLFTADDPIMSIPQGYSVIDMDVTPFAIIRDENILIDLIEPDSLAVDDFSGLDYVTAFDEMVDKMSKEYAFSEYYGIDWEDMRSRYRGQFEAAQIAADPVMYAEALQDFLWEIPDGHVSMSLGLLIDRFQEDTSGGFGIAFRELDDGRVIVNFLLPGSPAAEAGVELGAQIVAMDGVPINDVLDNTFVWAHEALGTDHTERLQQLRYASRRPLGETVDLTFKNPDDTTDTTVTLNTVSERQSFLFSSFNAGISGNELPVEFEILPSGYGYVSIYSFSDDEFLTVQLWERMIRTFKGAEVPGIIVDMRNNGGGSGYLADQLAAYFFNEEPIYAGNTGAYSDELDEFFFDERGRDRLYLPPEELRYLGPVAVIITPACFSACEFFSYNMTLDERADIVGHYPTGGLGGSVSDFYMPEGVTVRFTVGRAVDNDGNIHIEGKGVAPTIDVPVTEETLFAEDALLDAAERALTESIRGKIVDAGTLSFGETGIGTLSAIGTVQPDESVEYTVTLRAGTILSFYAGDETGNLDTILKIYDETGSTLLVENDDASEETRNSALEGLGVGDTDLTIIVAVSLGDGEDTAAEYFLQLEAFPETQDEDGDGEPDRSNEG